VVAMQVVLGPDTLERARGSFASLYNGLLGACSIQDFAASSLGRFWNKVSSIECTRCLNQNNLAVTACFPAAFTSGGFCLPSQVATFESVIISEEARSGDERFGGIHASCQLCYALVQEKQAAFWAGKLTASQGTSNSTTRQALFDAFSAQCGGTFDAALGPGTKGARLLRSYGTGFNRARGNHSDEPIPMPFSTADGVESANASFNRGFYEYVQRMEVALAIQSDYKLHPSPNCYSYVTVAVALALDIDSIPPETFGRSDFKAAFRTDVASLLGVEMKRVKITALAGGSVIVEFVVSFPAVCTEIARLALNAVARCPIPRVTECRAK